MTKGKCRLNKIERQLMLHLLDMSNSGEDLCNGKHTIPNWCWDWPIWSAGKNMPGYLPETPYMLFLTERAAKGHCRELEREPGGRDYVSDYMATTLRECYQ